MPCSTQDLPGGHAMDLRTGPDISVVSRLEEVADGVFAYIQPDGSWMINNTGFLVARDGVSVIDACATERRTRQFLATIAGVTSAPVRTLVNTHHHPDHTAGNGLFTGATIVAHDNARPAMRALGLPRNFGVFTDVDFGDLELALPFLTFADRLTLWADELRCELLFAGGLRTRPTTSWCGFPSARSSSPGICCSTAAPRFCSPGPCSAPSTSSRRSCARWRRRRSFRATDQSPAPGWSTRCWATSDSSGTSPSKDAPLACRPWSWPRAPTWGVTRSGATRSGSSGTCTGPTRTWPGRPRSAAGRSTPPERWATW